MAYASRHPNGDRSIPWRVYCDEHVPDGRGYPHELAAEWQAAKDAVATDSLMRDGYPASTPSTSTPAELVERLNAAGETFLAHKRLPWWPDSMMGDCACAVCGRNFATSEPQSFGHWDPRYPGPSQVRREEITPC